MPLHFVVDDPAALAGDEVVLLGREAHHAAAVRRVRAGEAVTVGDGLGVWLTGRVADVAPQRVAVTVESRRTVPAPTPRLVLVQALAKGDRDELAVQAGTEIGADEIVPWQAARSVSRWEGAKREKGRARWASIVREAAKQAHRAWIPPVGAPVGTGELAARASESRMLVLVPDAGEALTAVELDPTADADVVVVVGPEGGMPAEEVERLQAAGARPVRLGDTVLRTSTAGPAALAVVNAALRRW
ncbi:16S rRNA (uracil(1498)-N(3))-methyltransferase [Microbacterium aquimaris]|uniref:16S rRNA (uracil(1498)-N(3))-methyltransferase n=1 Tax=Microbacterium aquimaris TaxID=459816 RepID=UPI002AD2267B|nr:16S rRNA (uracil(1498)-N(3))-methyltransferase [Microbacterium aquimaris]MDZ8275925.1 16S rRNA (uracil(1498)-N(3))-methyltransferase [Microbacterium aquimaris]